MTASENRFSFPTEWPIRRLRYSPGWRTEDKLQFDSGAAAAQAVEAQLAAAAAAVACGVAARLGPARGLVASDVVALLPAALE